MSGKDASQLPQHSYPNKTHLQRLQIKYKQLLPRITPSPWRQGNTPIPPQALQAWRLRTIYYDIENGMLQVCYSACIR